MNRLIQKLTMVALLAAAATPLVAQSSPAARPPGSASQRTAASPDTNPDGGWPRAYVSPSGASIVLYQPQIASWPDQKHMTLYVAWSYLAKEQQTPAVGALKVESDTSVALEDRLVGFSEFRITEASFPATPKDDVKAIVDEILASVPRDQRVISLDRVLAMVDSSQVIARNVEGVKADPPPVFFSQTPAVLINLDGPPIWSPIPGTDLRFAVNTNWDLFVSPEPQTYYLRVDKTWLTASALQGPWRQASKLPTSFSS